VDDRPRVPSKPVYWPVPRRGFDRNSHNDGLTEGANNTVSTPRPRAPPTFARTQTWGAPQRDPDGNSDSDVYYPRSRRSQEKGQYKVTGDGRKKKDGPITDATPISRRNVPESVPEKAPRTRHRDSRPPAEQNSGPYPSYIKVKESRPPARQSSEPYPSYFKVKESRSYAPNDVQYAAPEYGLEPGAYYQVYA